MSVALDAVKGVEVIATKSKITDETTSHNNNALEPATKGSHPSMHSQLQQWFSTNVDTGHKLPCLAPATSLWTTERDGAVLIRSMSGDTFIPMTVPLMIHATVKLLPNNIAMAVKREGKWVKWTYTQYEEDIFTAAKSFIHLGLEPFNGVGIIGFNSPEWIIANLGCIYACGLSSGIYATNSSEACHFVAENCRANMLVVENEHQLQKILEVKDRLPLLKAIVQYTGVVNAPKRENFIYTWKEFMELGKKVPDLELQKRMEMLSPNKCCVLIYTSGTTGNPKGVMLSHDNITFTAYMTNKGVSSRVPLKFGDVSMVSYLPLSHIAAQMLDIYVVSTFGGTLYFAEPDALKGTLVTTLKEVRPHVFLGVPRVWEKIQESMKNAAKNAPNVKRRISRWAKGVGYKTNYALMNG